MTLLKDATRLYLGVQPVGAVYSGAAKAWPLAFDPHSLGGLTVWLDASQLALADGAAISPWPDLSGAGNHGTITGTPPPTLRTNALNSKAVARFRPNEGMLRGNSGIGSSGLPAPYYNYTIVYVTRTVGPTVGRAFSGLYPWTNFLVGFHSSGMDTAYDGSGFLVPASAYGALPTAWKLYGMTGSNGGSGGTDVFYSNGAALGSAGGGTGLQDRYNLSGYDATGTMESCDFEVAELLIYNRPLADAERQQVEAYLRDKWGLA